MEKAVQNAITSIFFAWRIPGTGKPSIGSRIWASDATMVGLNLLYAAAFTIGVAGFFVRRPWFEWLLAGLAFLDTALEFLFHGMFFITVSVIVSAVLTISLVSGHCSRSRRQAAQ